MKTSFRMKTIITVCLFLFTALAVSAAPKVTAEFDKPDQTGVEYFIEEKQPDGAWKEVAKGDGSPIVFTPTITSPGTYTIRAKARSLAYPALVSEPSNEATTTFPVLPPGGLKLTISLTVEVKSP